MRRIKGKFIYAGDGSMALSPLAYNPKVPGSDPAPDLNPHTMKTIVPGLLDGSSLSVWSRCTNDRCSVITPSFCSRLACVVRGHGDSRAGRPPALQQSVVHVKKACRARPLRLRCSIAKTPPWSLETCGNDPRRYPRTPERRRTCSQTRGGSAPSPRAACKRLIQKMLFGSWRRREGVVPRARAAPLDRSLDAPGTAADRGAGEGSGGEGRESNPPGA